jgi:hypothetical protein
LPEAGGNDESNKMISITNTNSIYSVYYFDENRNLQSAKGETFLALNGIVLYYGANMTLTPSGTYHASSDGIMQACIFTVNGGTIAFASNSGSGD